MSVFMSCAKRRSCRTCRRVLCNSQTLKTRQIRHRFIRRRPALAGCYAIEADHRLKGALQPDCVLDYRRESRVGGNNLVLPFDVAQHEMRQHRGPYLPFDRILVLSEERLELSLLHGSEAKSYFRIHHRWWRLDGRRIESLLAEREGFEPPDPCGSTVFKTAAIDHSATSPNE